MKRYLTEMIAGIMLLGLSGCGTVSETKSTQDSTESSPSVSKPANQAQESSESEATKAESDISASNTEGLAEDPQAVANKSIVVYYSRTDENYNVGNITVGNTAKVAAEIAKQTGANMFEIKPAKAYPADYKACIEVAQQEKDDNVRPQMATTVEHFEQYSTVYLGYPIWWGDAPMIVYTFIESQNFDNKTVIPFVTHEGSGLSGTPQKLRKALPKATVTDGIAITGTTAQNKPDEVTKKVSELIKQAQKD